MRIPRSEIELIIMSKYKLDYLDHLESEAIHIMREVAGQFGKPALLFSGGKDSITLVYSSIKSISPGKFPFPSCILIQDIIFLRRSIFVMNWPVNRRKINCVAT